MKPRLRLLLGLKADRALVPSLWLRSFLVLDDLVVLHDLRELQQSVFFRRIENGSFFWALAVPLEHRSVVFGFELFVGLLVVPWGSKDRKSKQECKYRAGDPDVQSPVLHKPHQIGVLMPSGVYSCCSQGDHSRHSQDVTDRIRWRLKAHDCRGSFEWYWLMVGSKLKYPSVEVVKRFQSLSGQIVLIQPGLPSWQSKQPGQFFKHFGGSGVSVI